MTPRGAWVCVTGGDLDVAQVTPASGMVVTKVCPEHMRMCPGRPYSSDLGQSPQAAGGGVAVHPAARLLRRIGPRVRIPIAWSIARPTARGDGIGDLGAFPHPAAPGDHVLRPGRRSARRWPRRSASPSQPQHRDEREVAGIGGLPGRAPGQEGAQVGFGVVAGGALETGQAGSHCQPQLISARHRTIGGDGGQLGEVS